jgi:NAD(P)-dependent dehydrogenase (short-subunit alcohol dehydrogenase family)
MDLGVAGRSYILVGGTRGMGYAAARVLAQGGARLTLVGRTADHANEQSARLAAQFAVETLGLAADASEPGALDLAVAASIDRFGPPRGLLASNGHTTRNADLLAMTDADWEHGFQDVLMGQIRACRAVLPAMIAAGGGHIVTTAAYSARVPKPNLFGYAAMKAALVNVTRNIAKTYGSQGVRANCICPGAVATDAFEHRLAMVMAARSFDRAAASDYIMRDIFRMPVALGRPGSAEEVGELMAFALSERAGYLSGAILNIDGGTDF